MIKNLCLEIFKKSELLFDLISFSISFKLSINLLKISFEILFVGYYFDKHLFLFVNNIVLSGVL